MQSQKAVDAYFPSEQLMLFNITEQIYTDVNMSNLRKDMQHINGIFSHLACLEEGNGGNPRHMASYLPTRTIIREKTHIICILMT